MSRGAANESERNAPWWARWGRWFLTEGRPPLGRRVRWRRVMLAAAAAIMVGWTVTATAAFAFLRRVEPGSGVRLVDVLAPWRWENLRRARAAHQFAEARRCLRAGNLGEGLMFARSGLGQVPKDREGRLLCADVLARMGRTAAARDLLLEGWPHHATEPAYLKPVLSFLLQQQEDARVVALAESMKPGVAAESDAARVLAMAAATACWLRGDFDQAEDWLGSVPRLAVSREGRLLAAKIEWDRGYRELALIELRQLATEWPREAEVHREVVALLRRQGLRDEARRRSVAFQVAFPEQAGPRIELLFAYHDSGDHSRVASEAESLLRDFAGDGAALLALAEFAANRGEVALARRVALHVAERRLPAGAFGLLAIEAMVVARDYRGAIDAIREERKRDAGARAITPALLDSLQAVASAGVGEAGEAELFLGRFLHTPNLRAENLLAVANRLIDLDAIGPARRALMRAIEVDPLNQAALTRLVDVEVTLNAGDDLAGHVQRLIRMRRPSPDVLRIAQHKLGSDLFLFSKECMAAAEAVQATLTKAAGQGRR